MKHIIIVNLFIIICSYSFALLFKINFNEYANIYNFLLGIYLLLFGIVRGNLSCFNLELIQNNELLLKISTKLNKISKITFILFVIQIILELIKFFNIPLLYFFTCYSFLLLIYSMIFYCVIIKNLTNAKKTILLIIEEQKNIL